MPVIMIALDGSPEAEEAIPFALAYREPQDELLLVRVVGLPPDNVLEGNVAREVLTEMNSLAHGYVDDLASKLAGGSVPVKTRVLHGVAREQIVQFAHEEKVNLLFIATRGKSGVKRWLLGSTAEQVCRTADVPVCLVPVGAQEKRSASGPQTVLVPLDLSEMAEKALAWMATRPPGRRLLLLHAAHMFLDDPIPGALKARCQSTAWAREYLERKAAPLRALGWTVECHVKEDSPTASILDVAEAEAVDAIVMSTHGRQGLDRWLDGSVAERVWRHSLCPVILVNPHVQDIVPDLHAPAM